MINNIDTVKNLFVQSKIKGIGTLKNVITLYSKTEKLRTIYVAFIPVNKYIGLNSKVYHRITKKVYLFLAKEGEIPVIS
jgi:hypothetical protein